MSPAIFLLLAAVAAQGDTGSFVVHNFRFASGEVLPELRLHYRTLGHPLRDAAGRNRMWRKMIIDDIRTDPDWKGGDYTTQPRGLRAALQLLFTAGSAPLVQQRLAPTRDSADAYITRWLDTRFAETDANDLMHQVDASRDYDPSTALDRITAPVLAINSADDFINPPELGLMERLIPRVKRARIGDTITAEAEIVSVHESKPVCQLKVKVARQTGETVLEGEAWCYTLGPDDR